MEIYLKFDHSLYSRRPQIFASRTPLFNHQIFQTLSWSFWVQATSFQNVSSDNSRIDYPGWTWS